MGENTLFITDPIFFNDGLDETNIVEFHLLLKINLL